jgi:type II secretory pathway pseudopilin PulG
MNAPRTITRRCRAGFSLVEAVICIMIVGLTLVAAMQTVGASAKSRTITQRRATGAMLAQDLMAEIVAQPYADPDGLNQLGLEAGEVFGDRSTYDDVDDYDGYTESPPRDQSNNVIPGFTGWRRTVKVDPVDPASPDTVRLLESGAKRITVIVHYGDFEAARLRAVRTSAADDAGGGG